ncbi:hypothetical protein LOTGIDRAFT_161826 [Lottia gigantea]|uniref:SUEL-type lectin domain-containing protein n=1 Tax=Lottia gigantea TaxID=225164 RepID=V3ZPC8_LOTGI|nr:hypothetical protein LOTGIDRAFT_161826 [Lottia gigantea]ESO93263.1 hypothetical protein LOTGIDRAFT_161826 [Lottia gigantea]
MWIKIGIIILISRLEATSSTVFNTTTCFEGRKGAYTMECKKNGTVKSLDIIAIRNVYYGTKLKASTCKQDACCLPNTTSDCIYRKNDKIEDIIKACSGNTSCFSQINRVYNYGNCKILNVKYSYFAHFAILEYACINIQKLMDMCDAGITKRDNSLYLTSNIFGNNDQTVNTTYSCVVTTNCNRTIQILAVDVRLALDVQNSVCYEELMITDGNTIKNITCQDSGLYSFQPIFTSNSNIVNINLTTRDKHIGNVWIHVQGTDDESEIEVRCGDNTQLPINDNHMCEKDKLTTDLSTESATNTASISLTTTLCTDCDQRNQDKQSGLSAGMYGGLIAAVILIILIALVTILVLISRSRKRENNESNENIYNTGVKEYHPYETMASPAGQATDGAVGVTNPAYYTDKEGVQSTQL